MNKQCNRTDRLIAFVLIAYAALLVRDEVCAQVILDLGRLPGSSGTQAYGVSADGTTVVGTSSRAFRWTKQFGIQALQLPEGWTTSSAYSVSDDGSVIVGEMGGNGHSHAFRWTPQAGTEDLGALLGGSDSIAWDVSGDGLTVVGMNKAVGATYYLPFAWRSGEQVNLPVLLNSFSGSAMSVSADGQTITGTLSVYPVFPQTTYTVKWNPTGGLEYIPLATTYFAQSISADGNVVVGQKSVGEPGFVWTPSDIVQVSSALRDVNWDGSAALSSNVLWTASDGFQSLTAYFTSQGVDLSRASRGDPPGAGNMSPKS